MYGELLGNAKLRLQNCNKAYGEAKCFPNLEKISNKSLIIQQLARNYFLAIYHSFEAKISLFTLLSSRKMRIQFCLDLRQS